MLLTAEIPTAVFTVCGRNINRAVGRKNSSASLFKACTGLDIACSRSGRRNIDDFVAVRAFGGFQEREHFVIRRLFAVGKTVAGNKRERHTLSGKIVQSFFEC